MALHNKKDFAAIYGIEVKDLGNYRKRKQIVINGDMIDTNNPTNVYWIEKRLALLEKKNSKSAVGTGVVSDEEDKLNKRSAGKKIKEANTKFTTPPETPTNSDAYGLDLKIKKQDLAKSEIETEIKKKKLEQVTGESVPTELVKNLMLHHNKSITVSFYNALTNFLVVVEQKAGLGILAMAELKAALKKEINLAVVDSLDNSKKTLRNIIAEHSQRKDVGERGEGA